MIGPVVHGPPVRSKILLIGQAPGPREGGFGKPFAWTAGRTLFRWFREATGIDEERFRSRVYMAAVARCFPGKAPGGGDRKPNEAEILSCRDWLQAETELLRPSLLLPVGTLAISQVFGSAMPLKECVGKTLSAEFHGISCDVICLPHPSGASTWHRMSPGRELLQQALGVLAKHPAWKATFALS